MAYRADYRLAAFIDLDVLDRPLLLAGFPPNRNYADSPKKSWVFYLALT